MIGLYFSGTGNSRFAAQVFLNTYDTSGKLIPIEEAFDVSRITDEEILLAYPIYYSSLPKILSDFIDQHASFWEGKKIFLICTMGLFSGDGCGCAARKLQKHGATIIGGLHLIMPDCITDVKLLKKKQDENIDILNKAQQKVQECAKLCKQGKPPQDGLSLFAHIAGLLGQRLWFGKKNKTYRKHIHIDDHACVHCGVCVNVCPMHNLSLQDTIVHQAGKCTMCYRCVNSCPQHAITILGKQVKRSYLCENYEELLIQKKPE